ncbi:hypothetical protein CEXT_232161 [Caerostris extrusa]|uniref:Uncharacterized protein n=1 Tax=Caerostris extrusa TaxID=172846 RepID=A0AAV4NYD2_CAEEX|nr:hypothetical protein CEXT_232161 [Caerostris extrusa]
MTNVLKCLSLEEFNLDMSCRMLLRKSSLASSVVLLGLEEGNRKLSEGPEKRSGFSRLELGTSWVVPSS